MGVGRESHVQLKRVEGEKSNTHKTLFPSSNFLYPFPDTQIAPHMHHPAISKGLSLLCIYAHVRNVNNNKLIARTLICCTFSGCCSHMKHCLETWMRCGVMSMACLRDEPKVFDKFAAFSRHFCSLNCTQTPIARFNPKRASSQKRICNGLSAVFFVGW